MSGFIVVSHHCLLTSSRGGIVGTSRVFQIRPLRPGNYLGYESCRLCESQRANGTQSSNAHESHIGLRWTKDLDLLKPSVHALSSFTSSRYSNAAFIAIYVLSSVLVLISIALEAYRLHFIGQHCETHQILLLIPEPI